MTTQLTDIGWSGPFGSGTWKNRAYIVDLGDEITVASGFMVNNFAGDDSEFTQIFSRIMGS